ncbi:MAG: ribokinase [Alcaligenaceae bacterium]|nr:ribokinase [Alcaligenaceae bacterium]
MKQLTVLGSVNADHVLRVPYFSQPGETLTGRSYNIEFGGKGANQAVAVARLKSNDTQVHFLGCIGDDAIGQEIKDYMSAQDIHVEYLHQAPNTMTGVAFIQVTDIGENSIVLSSGANHFVNKDYIEQHKATIECCDALLMQLETPIEGITQAAEYAKAKGKLVVLNPAPAQSLNDELLSLVDIITPNETETQILTGIEVINESSAKEAAHIFHQKGIQLVLITLGKKGVFVSEKNGISKLISGFAVEAVDTTAAGDTFNGGFLSEYINGSSLEDAIRFAQGAAALSVTRKGAQASVPTREEVLAFIR